MTVKLALAVTAAAAAVLHFIVLAAFDSAFVAVHGNRLTHTRGVSNRHLSVNAAPCGVVSCHVVSSVLHLTIRRHLSSLLLSSPVFCQCL